MDFYGRVKKILKDKKKLSIQEFVLSLGINHDTYYSAKSAGNLPRADEAVIIAKNLGTTVEYLVTGENLNSPPEEALNKIQNIINQYKNLPKK